MSLVVVKAIGLCTVQDFGRPGHMHEGLPHGGALVRSLLVRANRMVCNADGAAAIEVMGQLVVRATRDIATSVRVLRRGEEITVTSEPRRVAYLAVRGGVDAPIMLGSRSVHTSAGLGTPLREGVELDAGESPRSQLSIDDFIDGDVVRVIPGDAFDPALLATYRISPSSDRVCVGCESFFPAVMSA